MRLRTVLRRRRRRGLRPAGAEWRRRRIFEIELDRLRDLLAGELGDQRQREIDARGHAAAGHEIAVAHDARMDRDRAENSRADGATPNGWSRVFPEQSGGAKHQSAGNVYRNVNRNVNRNINRGLRLSRRRGLDRPSRLAPLAGVVPGTISRDLRPRGLWKAALTSILVGRFAQIAVMSGRRPVVKGCFEAIVNVSGAVMSTA